MTSDTEQTREFGPEERSELERLRAEVHPPAGRAGDDPSPTRDAHPGSPALVAERRGHPADPRGCALAPLSVVSVWARSEVTDTDRYVDTVAPLAKDPAVQAA